MSNTLLQIKNAVYNKLSEFDDSLEYDFNTVVKPRINSVIRNISKGEYMSYINPTVIFQGGDMSFLRKLFQFQLKEGYNTTERFNQTETEITLYSDFFYGGGKTPVVIPDGAFLMGGDIIPYTNATQFHLLEANKTVTNSTQYVLSTEAVVIYEIYIDTVLQDSNTYTLGGDNKTITFNSVLNTVDLDIDYIEKFTVDVSPLLKDYEISTLMERLITKPIDYYKQLEMKFNLMDNNYYKIPYFDFRYEKPTFYYTIIGNSSLGEYIYVKFYKYGLFDFSYYGLSVDLDLDTDITILPENYGLDIVAVIVAGELLIETEEEAQGQRLLGMGYQKLQMMYKNYAELDKETRQTVKCKRVGIESILGGPVLF